MWLRDLIKPLDRVKYLLWRVSKSRAPVTVRLHNGQRLILRPEPTTDLGTAREIFVEQAYRQPPAVPERAPEFIVDLGANVGYTVVHWTHTYPNAHLVAYEPHPQHISLLRRHLSLNSVQDRVVVVASAVSNVEAESFLSDEENESKLTSEGGDRCLTVRVHDLFAQIGARRIDLLKMDIEGGEYSILNDPRFAQLDVRTIAMEWHNTDEIRDGRLWCIERLTSLGFSVADGALRYENAGMLWAWRA